LWTLTRQALGNQASPQRIDQVWPALYAANRGTIGGNPNLIYSGQVLVWPSVS